MGSEASAPNLILSLDGFEGPLDLLLDLARAQKLDLGRISIVALVDQYLAVLERVALELAADWLVMAAWLAWLKSRLLLPPEADGAEEAEEAADVLAARLANLQSIRAAAAWLRERPQLGHDVFARGLAEDLTETDRSRLALDQPALVRAYVTALRRRAAGQRYCPPPASVWTVQDALDRLESLMGSLPDWAALEQFLPAVIRDPMQRRAALASTLLAGLEMARGGALLLRQEQAFGPILVGRRPAALELPA